MNEQSALSGFEDVMLRGQRCCKCGWLGRMQGCDARDSLTSVMVVGCQYRLEKCGGGVTRSVSSQSCRTGGGHQWEVGLGELLSGRHSMQRAEACRRVSRRC